MTPGIPKGLLLLLSLALSPWSFAREAPPSGVLSGSLEEARSAPLPREIALEVRARRGSSQWDTGAQLACTVSEHRFHCPIPAGETDARLIAPGFAPVYFWGLRATSGQTVDAGRIRLQPGASLSGWVVVDSAPLPPGETSVELRPAVLGWQGNPAERKRSELRHHRATAAPNGFFQVTGVGPGEYRLTAERQGFSPATVPVSISQAGEAGLAEPLRLEPLAPLQVWLSPATHLDGTPWKVELAAAVADTNVYESVAGSSAALDGSWTSQPLSKGTYDLTVRDRSGSILHRSAHEVGSSTPPVSIELDLVPVRGTLTLDGEPLSASLVFGTTSRTPNVRLDADEEGRFQGYLPREGTWALEILLAGDRNQRTEDVEVERLPSGEPDIVDVDLPATRIEGRVVARGVPVTEAYVVVLREAGGRPRREASLKVDREGRFEADGLSPGRVTLRAYDPARTSKWMEIDLADGSETTGLRLELGEKVTVRGQLLAAQGPAAGGLVVAWAEFPGEKPIALGEAVSAADGTFELSVDAGAEALRVVAVVPGCGAEIRRLPVSRQAGGVLAIPCAPGKGEILLQTTAGLLLHQEAGVDVNILFGLLDRAGLLAWSEDGAVLQGMPEGRYRHCVTGGCRDGDLAPGARLTFSRPSVQP